MELTRKSTGELFLRSVEKNKNNQAIGTITSQGLRFVSFNEYKSIIEIISLSLHSTPIKTQDKVAILSSTRPEWHYFDLSTQCIGGISVPIYHTYIPEEISFIINHSESKILIIENDLQFQKLLSIFHDLKKLERIIAIDDLSQNNIKSIPSHISYSSYKTIKEIGIEIVENNPDKFESLILSTHSDDISSIIYTSGTTGDPKGAVITHGAFIQMLDNLKSFTKNTFNEKDRSLIFLPLSHVFGRCDSYLHLLFGQESVYSRGMDTLMEDMKIVQPTFILSVPRVFEKMYQVILSEVSLSSNFNQKYFNWAIRRGQIYHNYLDKNLTPPVKAIVEYEVAKRTVFNKVYEKFGNKIRYFISGGAPLSKDINLFLKACNLSILEGYGLTETIAPCVLNSPLKQIAGTVGLPIGDVQIKFSDEGEIIVKSKALFSSYYRNTDATTQVLDSEGWFYTGDIGKFNNQGYLIITGRKKDIIITSGGKNIAPQKIESLFKLSNNIEQIIIVGDRQKYISALIFPLNESSNIRDLIEREVSTINNKLAQFEKIKKFTIMETSFNHKKYLTPSMKIKRNLIVRDNKETIDAMYND